MLNSKTSECEGQFDFAQATRSRHNRGSQAISTSLAAIFALGSHEFSVGGIDVAVTRELSGKVELVIAGTIQSLLARTTSSTNFDTCIQL